MKNKSITNNEKREEKYTTINWSIYTPGTDKSFQLQQYNNVDNHTPQIVIPVAAGLAQIYIDKNNYPFLLLTPNFRMRNKDLYSIIETLEQKCLDFFQNYFID